MNLMFNVEEIVFIDLMLTKVLVKGLFVNNQ